MNKIQWPHRSRSGEEKPEPPKPQVPAIETDPAAGLTTAQVEERLAAGLDNCQADQGHHT